MSGHSKWAKVKRQKAVTDTAKSRVFGKFARLIAVESKKAGGDASAPNLRAVIDRAKEANMPRDNIERAVQKGVAGDASSLESALYETYGPGGTAVLIDTLTDNRNRAAQEIKAILSKHECALASPGSAAWAFTKGLDGYTPNSTIAIQGEDEQKMSALLEALDEHDDVQDVYTNGA